MKYIYSQKIDDSFQAKLELIDISNEMMEIIVLSVPELYRGKGIGDKLLKEVCKDADRSKITLRLFVKSFGKLNQKQLESWYTKNGFNKIGNKYMIRFPFGKTKFFL